MVSARTLGKKRALLSENPTGRSVPFFCLDRTEHRKSDS